MRDDIHKKVPRPSKVQKWIKLCLRPADREAGRSLEALGEALRDEFHQGISPGFRNGLIAQFEGLPSLFSPLEFIHHPRDLGGIGTLLECSILNGITRRLAEGESPRDAIRNAGIDIATSRVESDIRCAEPILLGDSASNREGISQMQRDAAELNYDAIVGPALGLVSPAANQSAKSSRLSPDEDLRGGAHP